MYEDGYGYRIAIGNSWNSTHVLVENVLTEIDLVAKSLEVSAVWSFDSAPAIDILFPLYYFDGLDYVFISDYLTDFEGKIYISELMPIGDYKVGITEFSIIADDVVKAVVVTAESLLEWFINTSNFKGNLKFEFSFLC